MSLYRFASRELDPWLLAAVCATVGFGITAIYSATFNWEQAAAGTIYKKQIAWALVGLLGLALTLSVPLKFYYAFAHILYGAAILLLVLILEFGDRRWFNLGPIHIQPSELAKIATVLALARYLSKQNLDLDRVRTFLPAVLLVCLPALLVYRQPDLGTALVFRSGVGSAEYLDQVFDLTTKVTDSAGRAASTSLSLTGVFAGETDFLPP